MAGKLHSPQRAISQGSQGSPRERGAGRSGQRPGPNPLSPVLLAIVLLAALAPNWRSLGYDLVWDDKVILGPKLNVRGASDVARIWATPFDSFLGEPMRHPNYFRPATLLSLSLDRAEAGDRPGPYHRTNLLLYAIACVFLWLFVSEISGNPLAATAGTLVFALHPAHPESVCFVSGRTDLLAGAFLFASLWLAARWGPRIPRPTMKLLPTSAALLLALYSKEVSFFASPIPVLVLWIRERGIRPRDLALAALPVLAADAIYLACRWSVLGWQTVPAVAPVQGTVPQLLTSAAVLGRYLPLLLFPVSLSARHEVPPLRSPDAYFFLGLAALVLIAAGLVILFRRRSRWILPLSLFAATLLPLCYVRLIAGALVAERFLFVPSASLALAVAFLPGSFSYFVTGIAAPFFLLALLARVAVWKDDATLYTSMVRDSPNSPHAHAILGGYYYQQRDLPRAVEHQRRAFALMPEYTETLLDLAAAEDEMGSTDSSFAHIRLLLRLRPRYAAAWYALGNFYVRMDRPDSAVGAYRESIRLDPGFAQAENNLGVVLERMGRIEEAITHYRRAAQILPGYPDAANNLARLTRTRNP